MIGTICRPTISTGIITICATIPTVAAIKVTQTIQSCDITLNCVIALSNY